MLSGVESGSGITLEFLHKYINYTSCLMFIFCLTLFLCLFLRLESQLCHLKRRTTKNSNEADVLTNAVLTLVPGNLLCVLKVFCQHTSLKSRRQTQRWEVWLPCPSQPCGSDELRSIRSDFSGLQSDFDAHP